MHAFVEKIDPDCSDLYNFFDSLNYIFYFFTNIHVMLKIYIIWMLQIYTVLKFTIYFMLMFSFFPNKLQEELLVNWMGFFWDGVMLFSTNVIKKIGK